jgi:hypothetical protein
MLINDIPIEERQNLFNEMCYELFIKHKKGQTYARIMELILMNPVAIFGKEIDWTFGNEGRNEFIRHMFNSTKHFMNKKPTDNKVKKVNRTLKNPALSENN